MWPFKKKEVEKETLYEFNIQEDITAHEVAKLLLSKYEYQHRYQVTEKFYLWLPDSLKRHFKESNNQL